MNILAIGNSFSQDATRYLAQIAKADSYNLNVVNLYIGGCSLYTHFKNIRSDSKAYSLEVNGESTGFLVSIKESLLNRDWDYVTMQQVSHQSIDYDTFCPYLMELSAYVKKYAPKAKQIIHQTWAYEQDSDRLCVELGYTNQLDMFKDIEASYQKAAKDIDAEKIIPSGELFQKLLKNGFAKIHRDTFHASLGAGRYALGLLWYKALTGRDILNNNFCTFDEPITDEEIKIIKKAVNEIL